ncbi:MAG: hypothetical protein HYV61_06680 [Candidatus Rokubacteria bacterium]|nr:hypothetical protein [Candidatus Rokubacteria bacterium]
MPRRLLPLIVPLLLLGCAGTVRLDRPADFPNHASDHPFFDLHWRLERTADRVEAVGLVEASRVDGILEVTLELRGLDADGRVVSRGLGRTYGLGPFLRWQTRPFAVSLRPTGQEARFELEVWSYDWDVGRDGDGRNGAREQ